MIKELETKKAELEKTFEEKKMQAQGLENDIAVITQLLALKREHSKVLNEMKAIIAEHGEVCAQIEKSSRTNDEQPQ